MKKTLIILKACTMSSKITWNVMMHSRKKGKILRYKEKETAYNYESPSHAYNALLLDIKLQARKWRLFV